MTGRKLKHYNEYVRRCKAYAKASGIKVIYKDGDYDGGEYDPHRRILRLETELSESSEIACFLHELGHSIDDVWAHSNTFTDKLSKAYTNTYKLDATQAQIKLVIECEKRAWKLGRSIAKLLKIRLGKWYTDWERYGVSDYRKNVT